MYTGDEKHQIINISCPGCGQGVDTSQQECEWCGRPIVLSTFRSVYSLPVGSVNKYASSYRKALKEYPDSGVLNKSVAMCYLKLKMYDEAYSAFSKVIENNMDDSETYFYAAVSVLKGKKAFLASRNDINKCIELINAALMIEPRGIYYFFLAYVKYDFYKRKSLNTSPDYRQCLETAKRLGVSEYDCNMLFDILSVDIPSVF